MSAGVHSDSTHPRSKKIALAPILFKPQYCRSKGGVNNSKEISADSRWVADFGNRANVIAPSSGA